MYSKIIETPRSVKRIPVKPQPLGPLGKACEFTQPPSLLKSRWKLQDAARLLLPGERVAKCCRSVRNIGEGVQVYNRGGKSSFGGLQTCGSVWVCPICGAKIAERRRQELKTGIDNWIAQGGEVWFLTLTFPHQKHHHLAGLVDRFDQARRKFRNRPTWKKWAKDSGLVGSVRSLEVVYGSNGWHVHTHELLFVDPSERSLNYINRLIPNHQGEQWRRDLLPAWQRACLDSGLDEPNCHGLTMQDGKSAYNYAAKWGIDWEMTRGHTKKGRAGGLTPFDMLREVAETGDLELESKWIEFAGIFKGKQQLTWSRGLKDRLGLADLSDEELADQVETGSELSGNLTWSQWRAVLAASARADVLIINNVWGWGEVIKFVTGLARPVEVGRWNNEAEPRNYERAAAAC